jgi:type III secretory pathway component EscU
MLLEMMDILNWVSLFRKRNILYKKQYINKRNNLIFFLRSMQCLFNTLFKVYLFIVICVLYIFSALQMIRNENIF